MSPREAKSTALEYLDGLIAQAPEGPTPPARMDYHLTIKSPASLKLNDRWVDRYVKYAEALEEYPQISFFLGTTKVQVRFEENTLRMLRKRVAALPFDCFKVESSL